MTPPARDRHPPGPDHDHRPGPAGHARAGTRRASSACRPRRQNNPYPQPPGDAPLKGNRPADLRIGGRLSDAPVSSAAQQYSHEQRAETVYLCNAAMYVECPLPPPTGSSWIAVALISASVVHAARGPSPLTVTLMVGHGAGVSGEPRPGRPDAAGTQGHLLDGRLPTGCLETRGDPGQAEGCQPGIIQRARPNSLGRRSGPRNAAAEPASAFPIAGAQQGAASQHVHAQPRRHAE